MPMHPGEESPGEVTGTTIEELEKFRQDIERYRARRKAVAEEFEGFVRGFKSPAASPTDARPQVSPAPSRSPAAGMAPAAKPPAPAPVLLPPPPVTARPAEHSVFIPPSPDLRPAAHIPERETPVEITPAPPARRSWFPLAIVAALVVVIAAWQFGITSSDGPATESPAAATTAPPAATPAPAPVVQPTPPPDPFESVLTTTRAVWLRVTADGNRIVARELPGGARLPFRAEKTIEIRAGDAGAVRLSIGGRDQGALGADGAVATRSFTVPR